jgi:hypothetical protein
MKLREGNDDGHWTKAVVLVTEQKMSDRSREGTTGGLQLAPCRGSCPGLAGPVMHRIRKEGGDGSGRRVPPEADTHATRPRDETEFLVHPLLQKHLELERGELYYVVSA